MTDDSLNRIEFEKIYEHNDNFVDIQDTTEEQVVSRVSESSFLFENQSEMIHFGSVIFMNRNEKELEETSCTFGVLQSYYWGSVQIKKKFGNYLCKQSTLALVVKPYLFFLFCLWSYFFGSFGLFFGSGSGSKTFLEPTNVDYQFFLEVQSYLFVFKWAKYWAFFDFLGPCGQLLGLQSDLKTFLGPTYIDNQFLFWNYHSIFGF